MPFKSITNEQEASFRLALAAGQYNLLLGAGSSMDSHNVYGPRPSGEALKRELCRITNSSEKHSLQRVFSLLSKNQIEENITKRFSNCIPGPTPLIMKKFLWKRIFTWNIDDVIENTYSSGTSKQQINSIHYNDDFIEAETILQLNLIHLHGSAQFPSKGYVFSREHYIKQVQTVNPWMAVLSTFMRSEPMIIAGTSLDEVDLDYYLSFRNTSTSRTDRGPSVLVTSDDDAITADLCERHNMLHFIGWTKDFFEYCESVLPNPPTPEELIPQEERNLIPNTVSKSVSMAFYSDFELVPASAKPSDTSRFQYGHPATWNDLAANLDIPRPLVSDLVVELEASLAEITLPRLLVLLENAGTGKTTTVRRTAFEMAQRGIATLYCSSLSRIDKNTANVLNTIERPVVVIVDDFADQVTAIAETISRITKPDIVFLASERAYRSSYISGILAGIPTTFKNYLSMDLNQAKQLIEKYIYTGNVGDHNAIKNSLHFSQKIKADPIAVACCKIMNDFKPLDRIVDDIVGDANELELDRYLCTAIAQHCFMGGVKFDILTGAVDAKGAYSQLDKHNPLPLAFYDKSKEYVVPENAVIAERVLSRTADRERHRMLGIFVDLANSVQPFVNRQAIRRRTPEARMSGRLFDFDDIVDRFLGKNAEAFYQQTKDLWQWNSRYWEQVALLNLARYKEDVHGENAQYYLDEAVQHARHAVAIEYHPFGLTTLGKILMSKMLSQNSEVTETFSEAFKCLVEAIEKEAIWARRAVQPFVSLFYGVRDYLSLNGKLSSAQRETLRAQAKVAINRFPKEIELLQVISEVQDMGTL
jgi:hypothetical protein